MKRIIVGVILTIIIVASTLFIGHLPVHRTDIIHTDPEGDVDDDDNPNIDIIELRSYNSGHNIILEMTVVGMIQVDNSTSDYFNYAYIIGVIARDIEDLDAHVYHCRFDGVREKNYGLVTEVANSTLRIIFPKTTFLVGSYMIGLEGTAMSPWGEDNTLPDRDGEIARLFF